jgi:ADP-heptose:LPS heptosyltransferase
MTRVLIVRNDKLGDFMLSYPAYALLKLNNPDCEVHVLVPHYTYEMAKTCPWIDNILIDPGPSAPLREQLQLLRLLKLAQYDAMITLFSTTRVAVFGLLARIKWRLAPATKAAQYLYPNRIKQRRSRSEKPEYQYNMDLVRYYLSKQGLSNIKEPTPPFLQFDPLTIQQLRNTFCHEHGLPENHLLIFIHPGSGGSAVNLSNAQYHLLASKLALTNNISLVITAGPNEDEKATALANSLNEFSVSVYHSTKGLLNFARHIALCDIFVSGSTGPLHIAGALDRPTVAFYPRRRSATPLRWQTLNSPERRLAFTPPDTSEESDMSKIDIDSAVDLIRKTFLANLT